MRGQGLRRELQRHSSVHLDHCAPRGSEDVASSPTDGYPSPQDRHGFPAGMGAGLLGYDYHRRAWAVGGPYAPLYSYQTLMARGPERPVPCVWELVMDGGPHISSISPCELEPLQDVSFHRHGEAGSTNPHSLP